MFPSMELAVFIHQIAVHEGVRHAGLHPQSLVGRPMAFGKFVGGRNQVLFAHVHERQVGVIAFADEASAVDLVQDGRIVTHQLHHLRESQLTLVNPFEHHFQRMLNGRESRLAGEIVARVFLVAAMRRMVGSDGVNQSVLDGFHQRHLVLFRLDGRIALDGEFHFLVVFVAKPKVMRASFSGYLLVFQRNVISKQFQVPLPWRYADMEVWHPFFKPNRRPLRKTCNKPFRCESWDAKDGFWTPRCLLSTIFAYSSVLCWISLLVFAMRGNQARRLLEQSASKTSSLSTSILPVLEPMNTLMPQTLFGSVSRFPARLSLVAPR